MLKDILRFSLLLLLCTGVTYLAHFYITTRFFPEQPVPLINFSYKFNLGFTLLFTTTMILVSEHLKSHLGFIYLISTFIKLAIFLFILKTSGIETGKTVFVHFFIPYVVCVVLEIIYVIKILNRTNFSKDN